MDSEGLNSCSKSLIHSFIHSFIRFTNFGGSLTHSLTHSPLTHSHTHHSLPPYHPPTHSLTHTLTHSWPFINFSLDSSIDTISKVSLSSSLGWKDFLWFHRSIMKQSIINPWNVCAIPIPDSILFVILPADVTKPTIETTQLDMDSFISLAVHKFYIHYLCMDQGPISI